MAAAKRTLTQARLKELLSYDPETGLFTWLVVRRGSVGVVPGKLAGCKAPDGRMQLVVDCQRFRFHRLAWFYMHGVWPAHGIDHIDGNVGNNKLANLREATQKQNLQNIRKAHKRNKCGLLGVYFHKTAKKWNAKICIDRKSINLGWFVSAEEAYAAYCLAKEKLHPFQTLVTADSPTL